MTLVIKCPDEVYSIDNVKNKKLFLAGGISGCSDWQKEVINKLEGISNLTIYNPRRDKFDVNNKDLMEEQIIWEFKHMNAADVISFWFSKETLNPIVLYELGRYNNSNKNIIIGIDPEYKRKEDVIIQTKLARMDINIFYFTIESFCNRIQFEITRLK